MKYQKILLSAIAILIIILILLLNPKHVSSERLDILEFEPKAPELHISLTSTTEEVKAYLGQFWASDHLIYEVLECESNFKSADEDGEPLESPTGDWGIGQINAYSWDEVAQKLGLDYKNDPEDNVEMIRVVLDTQGIEAYACYYIIMGIPIPW